MTEVVIVNVLGDEEPPEYYLKEEDIEIEEEEYDCPIHGKLGGIDECPLCGDPIGMYEKWGDCSVAAI